MPRRYLFFTALKMQRMTNYHAPTNNSTCHTAFASSVARSTSSVSSFERFKRFNRLRWLESVEVRPLPVLPSTGGTFDLHPPRLPQKDSHLALGLRRRM